MRDGLNLCRLSHRLVRREAALRVNQVRRKDSVDERRLSQSSLAFMSTVHIRIKIPIYSRKS
jgi:hypothetical protein